MGFGEQMGLICVVGLLGWLCGAWLAGFFLIWLGFGALGLVLFAGRCWRFLLMDD